jgi:hypothetical protein
MATYNIPDLITFEQLPEFLELQKMNPSRKIEALPTAVNYGRAIHWLSFFKVLWPDFSKIDEYRVEVGYLVINDPGESLLPVEFYDQMVLIIETFWEIQLSDLYPNGDWKVTVWDDPERSVTVRIKNRNI